MCVGLTRASRDSRRVMISAVEGPLNTHGMSLLLCQYVISPLKLYSQTPRTIGGKPRPLCRRYLLRFSTRHRLLTTRRLSVRSSKGFSDSCIRHNPYRLPEWTASPELLKPFPSRLFAAPVWYLVHVRLHKRSGCTAASRSGTNRIGHPAVDLGRSVVVLW